MANNLDRFKKRGGIDPNPPFDFTTGPWAGVEHGGGYGSRIYCVVPPTAQLNKKHYGDPIDRSNPLSRAWLEQPTPPDGTFYTLMNVTGAGYLMWSWVWFTDGPLRFRITIDGVLKLYGEFSSIMSFGDILVDLAGYLHINRQRNQVPSANMDEHTKLYCKESADKFGLRFNSSAKIEVAAFSGSSGTLYAAADYFFDGEI